MSGVFRLAVVAVAIAAGLAAGVTATSTHGRLALTLTAAAVVVLVIGLILQSASTVGAAGLPMLGAALIEAGVADDPTPVLFVVVGCAWFVTAELAWEAIDRRDEARRTSALTQRRINEVATVVAVSLVTATVGVVASSVAPTRTVLVQAIVVVGVPAALVAAATRVARTAPGAASDG